MRFVRVQLSDQGSNASAVLSGLCPESVQGACEPGEVSLPFALFCPEWDFEEPFPMV